MGAFEDLVRDTIYPMIRDASLTLAAIAIMASAMRAMLWAERGEVLRTALRSLSLLAVALLAPAIVELARWIAG